jgi:MSHA type pilus biogenesis protein MshL
VSGADLRALLSALAQNEGLNLAMDPAITDTITVDLDNVTFLEALDAILTPRGLQFEVDGNLLRVRRLQMQFRTFPFDYITTQRTLGRSISANASAGGGAGSSLSGGLGGGNLGGGASSTSLSGAEVTNLLQDVEVGVTALKSPTGSVIFNKMAGLIFVTDYPQNLNSIEIFLNFVQNAVNRQVVIEARFIEIQLNEDFQAGVNWNAVLGNTVTTSQGLGTSTAFQVGITGADFNVLLNLLSDQGTVNVLSNPTVLTMNNQPAIVRVGTQDVFFTTTTQVDPRTGTIIQTATTPSTINEGVVLDVTPMISGDGVIMMNIHPTITERTGQAVSPQGDTVPIVDVRETDVVVRVADGETVIIAGLISDRALEQISKVPLLGDIPLVGNIFRRTTRESRKTDLAILLTPRILTIRTAVDYTRSRTEAQQQLRQQER